MSQPATPETPDDRYKREVAEELRHVPNRIAELGKAFLMEDVANPLAESVEQTFRAAAGQELGQLFSVLGQLDSDLFELQQLQHDPDPAHPHYELWARYWTSVAPEVQVVKRLVTEVIVPHLPVLRTHLRFGLDFRGFQKWSKGE